MSADEDKEVIEAWFKRVVEGWMVHDLNVAIHGGANVLAALGLACWCETLGGVLLGTVEDEGGNRKKFEAILDRLPAVYKEANEVLPRGLYSVLRSGLAHEFVPKGNSAVYRTSTTGEGIVMDNGRPVFVLEFLLRDFLQAATEVRDHALTNPQPQTVAYMRRTLDWPAPSSQRGVFTSGNVHTPQAAPATPDWKAHPPSRNMGTYRVQKKQDEK